MSLEEEAIARLRETFPLGVVGAGAHAGQQWVEMDRGSIVAALLLCRTELGCDMLTDLTAVDWMDRGKPERFQVVYQLYAMAKNQSFRLKVWVPETDPSVPSATSVWKAAGWAEREVWDLFGITFPGNPDLRRLVLPENYTGHPLRKDYPLIGQGERNNFPRYGL